MADRPVSSPAAQALFDEALRLLSAKKPSEGRQVLRAAMQAGHTSAGLFEAALAANGSGAPSDWAAALAVLRQIAPVEPDAARQLELLGAMDLDDDGCPKVAPQYERIGTGPDVYRARRLLSPDECAHIARSAADLLAPTTVFDPVTRARRVHPVRTSSGATIGPTRQDLVITAILKRIAVLTRTRFEWGEPVSLLHYAPGQQYRPHVDAIPGETNQRTHTVLLYLNEGYGGGGTHFEASGLTVSGKGGDAVFFANTLASGLPDPATRHAGLPVGSGAKWLATRWIRQGPFDPWTHSAR